jgi:hypothetical protein
MLASLKPESSTMKPGVFEFVIVAHAALIIDCCGAHSTSGLGQRTNPLPRERASREEEWGARIERQLIR